MNFFQFLFFDLISFIIHIILLLFAYRFLTKHKCNLFSKIAEKQIEDFWGTFEDKSITDINTDSMDKFVESIKVLDEEESQTTSTNTEQSKFF